MIGTVTELKKKKGHGFLQCEGHDSVYFKREWLEGLHWENLQEGETVEFELVEEGGAMQARRVRRSGSGTTAALTPHSPAALPVAVPAPTPAARSGPPGRFLNPYNFVRFLPEPDLGRVQSGTQRLLCRCPPPPHDRYVGLSGSITCEVEAKTPLFVSDSEGIQEIGKGHKSYRFFQYDGERALPGASLRGAVRGVFEAVTNSCLAVFGGEVQSYHFDSRQAPWLVPARVEHENGQWRLRLLTGTEQLRISAPPDSRQYAAWLHRYWPMRPSRTLTRDPDDDPPVPARQRPTLEAFQQRTAEGNEVNLNDLQHSAECYALLADTRHPHPRIRFWDVLELSTDRNSLVRKRGSGQQVVKGWICLINQNIEPKHSERFFFRDSGQRGHPEHIDLPEPVRRAYMDLIRDYQERHQRDVKHRQQQGIALHAPAGAQDAALSRFIYTDSERHLRGGELVYAKLEGTPANPTVNFIVPVSVPRVTYEHSIADILRAHHPHLQRCTDYNSLCPACRAFGWVRDGEPPNRGDRVAYAGRLRFSHARHTVKVGEPKEVALAILSSPKPTTVLFYLARADGNVPRQWPDGDINAGYDGDVSLRGRKVYRHHGQAMEDVYRSDDKGDQNRTALDMLLPGNKFEFTIEFENLAPVELGALLWSLEMDGAGYHRLGYARPLGLGSVQMRVKVVQLLQPEQRYRSLAQTGLRECLRGQWQQWVEEFKRSLAALYSVAQFEGLDNVRDLRALLGEPATGLPIHYPRDPDGQGQGENFRWFMQNRRNGRHALPVPTDESDGLPLRP